MRVKCMVNILLLTASGLLFLADQAMGQAYPARAVRVVVPFASGSSTDLTGRIVGGVLATRIGQPVVIDNRPGANGMIGTEAVSKAEPDGYTLLLGTNATHGANVSLFEKMQYDPVRDFQPITQVLHIVYLLVASNSLPAGSVAELVALAKANPGKYTLATTGGISQLTGELFKHTTGIKLTDVPYKAPSGAFVDIAAGRVDMLFIGTPPAMPQIAAGRMKALAITSRIRSVQAPTVPTVEEQGYPGFQATSWIAYFAPAGVPKSIVTRLNTEIVAILKDAGVRAQLLKNGTTESEIVGNTPEQLAEEVDQEIAKWKKLVSAIGVPKI